MRLVSNAAGTEIRVLRFSQLCCLFLWDQIPVIVNPVVPIMLPGDARIHFLVNIGPFLLPIIKALY